MNIEEKVKKLIEPQLTEIGVKVDKVEYVKEGNNYFLRITIDKEDLIEDSYILDVTSKERGGHNA